MRRTIRELVERAVELVHRDAPRCADGVAAALGPIAISLTIDNETMLVTASGRQVVVGPVDGDRGRTLVEVTMRGEVVLDLVHGEDALLPAILANRVRVRTPPAHAHRLFDGVNKFVDGCARSADGTALLQEFRDHVAAATERS